MKEGTLILVLALIAVAAVGWAAEPVPGVRALDKKLIEYAWDVPFPDFIRANLCRQRLPRRELTAWSTMVQGFLEHDLFGTWVFK